MGYVGGMVYGNMGYVGGMVYLVWEYGRTTVCGMVCVDGMVREKHSIWYGTFAVWYHGTMSWMYYMAKFAWWYGMFQCIRSVGVEYVVRISSATSLYIGHWKGFKNISLADRQTDRQTGRQTDRFAFTKTETQFYNLRIRFCFGGVLRTHSFISLLD